jgi:sporulation protein YlmC with PRC-barrel domain
MSYIKREDVLGKQAVTPDGNTFGNVKDLAFSTSGDVGLVMSRKDGSEVTVSIKQISAIGEFVLLSTIPSASSSTETPSVKRATPQPEVPSVCPSCGSPLRQGAKFCGRCGHKLV